MLWKKSPVKISVEFVEYETGVLVGRTDAPLNTLPASFEAATTLNLNEADWSVERAEPMTAEEFQRSGKLKLWLRRIHIGRIDPKEILLSLPTICEWLAEIAPGSTKLGKSVLELHEDDWRQVEFVSLQYQTEIESELVAIARIYHEERKGPGFQNLQVRSAIEFPLADTSITTHELQAVLRTDALDGVAYAGVAGLVEGGFALPLSTTACLYGVENNGAMTVLGLQCSEHPALNAERAQALAAWAQSYNLCLVDWCRALQLRPHQSDFVEYLCSRSSSNTAD